MSRATAWQRYLVWCVLAVPAVYIAAAYATGRLFYGEAVHLSGEWSVRLLIVALAATPLVLLFPGRRLPRWLLAQRRYFGVASFAYAALHTWVYIDKTADLSRVLDDAVSIEYLSAWIATAVFFLLTVTSNDASMRYLKRLWKTLHRLVYVAAILSFVHWLLVAFDPLPAVVHLLVLTVLEVYRVVKVSTLRRAAA